MASTRQDELYQNFLRVARQQTSALGDATALLAGAIDQASERQSNSPAAAPLGNASALMADVIAQVNQRQSSSPAPAATGQAQTGAQTGSNSGGSTAGTVGKTILQAQLGLPFLIAGLIKAFGGGDKPTPPPLVKYAMPAAVDFQAVESQGQVSGLDYDQRGTPRSYAAAGTSKTASGGNGSGAAPQITFNVQAMDARSFLDRSGDIAAAVRDAMLNLNSINDVVNDL